MARIEFVPFVDMALSRSAHDRWVQAYEFHRQKLTDGSCDRRCRMRQFLYMSQTLSRTVVCGILHAQTIALRSDCTLALLESARREYLAAIGVTILRLPQIDRELATIALEANLEGRHSPKQTLFSLN